MEVKNPHFAKWGFSLCPRRDSNSHDVAIGGF